jgi:hypothetical protein
MSEIMSIVCPHVFADERPVRVMIHHGDGNWQAVCGQGDHDEDCNDFEVVAVSDIFARQANLAALETLPADHIAEWIDGEWEISSFDEDDGPL